MISAISEICFNIDIFLGGNLFVDYAIFVDNSSFSSSVGSVIIRSTIFNYTSLKYNHGFVELPKLQ